MGTESVLPGRLGGIVMRRSMFYCFFVLGLFSCESMLEVPVDESVGWESAMRLAYECSNRSCLPKVTVTGDRYSVNVSWSSISSGNDHRFKLSVSGASGQVSKSSEGLGNYGSWYFPLMNVTDEGYTVSYSIRCYTTEQCEQCEDSGSFCWRSDGTGGTSKDYYECFKEYHTYSIREDGEKILLDGSTSYEKEGVRYMDLNRISVYEISYPGRREKKMSGGIQKTGEKSYVISGLPKESLKTYEVILSNTECEVSEQVHYLYFTYRYISPNLIVSQYTTSLVDQHKQGL